MKRLGLAAAILLFLSLLTSCIGVNMGITLNRDGSGTVTLEYLVSQALESLGRLDGNERWNTIPVGRADFERTMDRLPGMKLLSFSSRGQGRNLATNAKMEFANLRALMAFLDAGGLRSSLQGDAAGGRMVLTLSERTAIKSPGLDKLIADICEGYSVRISMTVPGQGAKAIFITDKEGKPFSGEGESSFSGNTLSCSFPLYTILSSGNGLNVEFSW